jgi:hypothetical protein
MDELARLVVLLALAGLALTVVGTFGAKLSSEPARLRRSLRKVLKADPHALLVARGKGVGFNFAANLMAVSWDAGAWCLVYRLDELLGAELFVDGQVAARAYRGEARRPLDLLTGADKQVRLRLIFDDPRHPDFELELWLPEDEGRKGRPTAAEAVEEANRWVARVEAVVRKPLPVRPAAAAPEPALKPAPEVEPEAPPPPPAGETRPVSPPPATSPRAELPFDDPPWAEDDPDPPLVDNVNR